RKEFRQSSAAHACNGCRRMQPNWGTFRPAPVAVSFDQQLAYDFNDEPDIKKAGPSPTSTAPNRAIAHSWENATSGVGPAQKILWTRIICFSHRRRAPRSGRSI